MVPVLIVPMVRWPTAAKTWQSAAEKWQTVAEGWQATAEGRPWVRRDGGQA